MDLSSRRTSFKATTFSCRISLFNYDLISNQIPTLDMTYSNLSDSTLADASISDDVPLFIRFELFDSVYLTILLLAPSLVDSAIGTGGNEAEDGILVPYTPASVVSLGSIKAHGVLEIHVRRPIVCADHESKNVLAGLV